MTPNLHRLELDITYVCGMGCPNCNRLTDRAPSTEAENLSLQQIATVIQDSIAYHHRWLQLNLVGGEPTLHPDIDAIVDLIADYRKRHNPRLRVVLATHGHGEKTVRCIDRLKAAHPFLKILNTHKEPGQVPRFAAMCIEPEVEQGHIFTGCKIPFKCGMGLNYQGFYPCAIAGAIDRVFGFQHAIHKFSDLTVEKLVEGYPLFCRLCGHYRPVMGQLPTSATWQAALTAYSRR